MASATWPSSLPPMTYPAASHGYSRQADSGVLRTQMDAGPPKMRARYSAVIEPFSFSMVLTESQWETLHVFYRTTLGRVARFNMTDAGTGNTVECRFTDSPKRSAAGGGLWNVHLALEVMP